LKLQSNMIVISIVLLWGHRPQRKWGRSYKWHYLNCLN